MVTRYYGGTMEKNIVTLTLNPALDKISGVTQVVPNHKLRCDYPKHEAGGGGINVSRAIRRFGGDSLALFPCGGPNGEIIKSKLEEEHVKYKIMPIIGDTRENITIFEGNSNQQFRFIMPGPELTDDEWENTLDFIKDLDVKPDYLVVSGSNPGGMPDDFYGKLSKLAKKIDCRLIVDTSGEGLKDAADAGVYLLKPNMRELGQLAGGDIKSETHQREAARALVDSGNAEVVIVSLGAGGALLVTSDASEQLRSPTVPIRSKLGAGDSMVAGIVLKLAQGADIREATQYGIAAGAATVMTEGTELCNKTDTDNLFAKIADSDLK